MAANGTSIWISLIEGINIMERALPPRKEDQPMQQPFLNRFLFGSIATLMCGSLAFGHIRIAPTESIAGAREKYTMRVPNEKQLSCSKIEGEFPAGLDIYDFEFK